MKIQLELPSGLRITFEGDEEAFDRFTSFLAALPGLAEPLGSRAALPPASDPSQDGMNEPEEETEDGDPLDARRVMERLEAVEAKSDIDRVTVMAQLAVEAGLAGLDYDTADRLFEELGFPKPPRFAKTFHNAKARNFLRSTERGVWKPTVQGENFARLGHKEAPLRRRAARRATQPALNRGGESD